MHLKVVPKTIKLVHISHLLLQLLIEHTTRFFCRWKWWRRQNFFQIIISFVNCFHWLFWKKNIFILGPLYDKGNLFLINLFKSGSKGSNSVKNEVTLKSILTLCCCAISLEILATSENYLLTLCRLYHLAI